MGPSSAPYSHLSAHTNFLMDNFTAVTEFFSTGTSNISECSADERSLDVALAVLYGIVFIIGLTGNVLALYVFLCIHSKRNSIQVYLLNTAIADLLMIFCLPFRIAYHLLRKWNLGVVFCKVIGNLFYMNMYMSIVLLGLISIDRYVKVKKSLRRHKAPNRKCSIRICCCLWAVATVAVIFLIVNQSTKENTNGNLCFYYTDKKDVVWQAAFNYLVVLIFWLVFLSLILSYVKIAKNLFRISRERSHLPSAGKYIGTAQKSFFVLFIFTVCFVPYHTFRIFYIASQLQNTSCYWTDVIHKTNEIMLVLSALNSCLDPIMYFLLSRSIRKTVFQLICRVRGDSGRSESNTSDMHQGHTLNENVCVPTPSTHSHSTIGSKLSKNKGFG
ncbi:probable G-protein coupled receptor 34 [Spea bombifrons]|uniref:probable G-protein coupled receptor 34 n=1 Tax=Spea bombifrons TaxID=233779 RepID=UPI00234C02E8|nr:probable G-protein coupled receptor 34 [Spea bombifrons]